MSAESETAAGHVVAVRDGEGEVMELHTVSQRFTIEGEAGAPVLRLWVGGETVAVFAPGAWVYVARPGVILSEGGADATQG